MSDSHDTPLPQDTPEAPASPKFRLPWKRLLGAVVIVLLVLPFVSTLQAGYYHRYPKLRPRMDSWRVSTHARISCTQCHVEPEARGVATFWARSIPAFYSQVVVGPKRANVLSVPGRRACQKCHTTYRRVSASGDLLIPHRAHVEVLGVGCATCHKDLVHSNNRQGFNQPEMETCLTECHDGDKATDKCAKCHTGKQVPRTHREAGWLQAHGELSEKVDCGTCHAWTPDYCRECHEKRPASHVGNWKKDHQVPAKKRGEKGCVFCHEGGAQYCKKCHD